MEGLGLSVILHVGKLDRVRRVDGVAALLMEEDQVKGVEGLARGLWEALPLLPPLKDIDTVANELMDSLIVGVSVGLKLNVSVENLDTERVNVGFCVTVLTPLEDTDKDAPELVDSLIVEVCVGLKLSVTVESLDTERLRVEAGDPEVLAHRVNVGVGVCEVLSDGDISGERDAISVAVCVGLKLKVPDENLDTERLNVGACVTLVPPLKDEDRVAPELKDPLMVDVCVGLKLRVSVGMFDTERLREGTGDPVVLAHKESVGVGIFEVLSDGDISEVKDPEAH